MGRLGSERKLTPQTATDIVPADNEVGAILITPTDQEMDVRVVGVVMCDRDPIEPGCQICFGLRHEVAREFSEVAHLRRVLG